MHLAQSATRALPHNQWTAALQEEMQRVDYVVSG